MNLPLPSAPENSLLAAREWTLARLEDPVWPLMSAPSQKSYRQALMALRLSFWQGYRTEQGELTDAQSKAFDATRAHLGLGLILLGETVLEQAYERGQQLARELW